ncbi:hypothetical protein [Blastococcus sp. PRF04-17]|uniref:hypothetical protein n=1 Tax=Blastococcus sp. PRF04-17 TaxID=2933797 RepID=UPI0035301E5B
MSPSCGSSWASRTNSSTKASGSGTLKVKIRRWPKVPACVTTLRARNTRGIVDGTSAPAAAGSVDTSTAMVPSDCSTARGAYSRARARPVSSACRSRPIAAAASLIPSSAAIAGALGATSQGSRSSRRTPALST